MFMASLLEKRVKDNSSSVPVLSYPMVSETWGCWCIQLQTAFPYPWGTRNTAVCGWAQHVCFGWSCPNTPECIMFGLHFQCVPVFKAGVPGGSKNSLGLCPWQVLLLICFYNIIFRLQYAFIVRSAFYSQGEINSLDLSYHTSIYDLEFFFYFLLPK